MMRLIRKADARTVLSTIIIGLIMFSGGWYASRAESLHEMANNAVNPVRVNDPQYPFISPLVSVAIPNATGFPELKKTKNDVQDVVSHALASGKASDVGVYFRQPGNAHWFGINENDKFDPGSLIKVPIMVAYLKEAENDPTILKRYMAYDTAKNDPLPNALPPQLSPGNYTAERLLQAMIINSDNIAKDALAEHISPAALQDVFDEMSANFLKDPTGTISPKQYVIILQRIYNATYLDRPTSNEAMQLLTETTFKDGLVANLPGTIKVAHKYGERGIYEDTQLVGAELHDCGLIYAQKNPYYLCVMTKGSDVNTLAGIIRDISNMVYKDKDLFAPSS